MANFPGTIGNDNLVGTIDNDTFDITLGGSDIVSGDAGDDTITAGAKFDALDQLSGGSGYDKLLLTGDYSGGVTLGANTLTGIEEIKFGAGFSYKLVMNDNNVAAGDTLKIDAYSVGVGKSVYFDGSAETDGKYLFYDGQSNDTFIGGAKSDTVSLAYNGNDTVMGNGGNDVITAEKTFDAGDVIDGGDGKDVLYLRGNYGAGLAITSSMMTNIETLGLAGFNSTFAISIADGVVKAGENLFVTAEGITGTGQAYFNGAAETDGTFSFRDSIGNDNFSGGANNDVFYGVYGGSDIFQGNNGDDTFYMTSKLDATDEIYGGQGTDIVYLSGDYSGGVTFDMFTLNNVEKLGTYDGFDYKIKTDEATVGPGKSFDVLASYLSAGHKITFDGSAETDGSFNFYGGQGDDSFTGGAGKDYFDAHNGGNDKFYGGAGNDQVSFFNAYTTADFADGGDGSDSAYIYGDFAGGLTLGSAQFVNMESITLGPGYSYNVTTLDSLVGAGKQMAFDTYWSVAGQNFTFDGSGETDGSFRLTGGDGNDSLSGSQKNDIFYLNRGGNDVMNGNGGDDTFYISEGFTADDQINGGAGTDKASFGQEMLSKVTFTATTMTGIEKIDFFSTHNYNVATHDANFAAGQNVIVSGSNMQAGLVLKFDGSAETDASFDITAGAGTDVLSGGAMNDKIAGGAGNDTLRGNAGFDTLNGGAGTDMLWGGDGKDVFVFKSVADIGTGASSDTIRDWNSGDKIDLTAIDTSPLAGDQAFTFVAGAFTGTGVAEVRVVTNATATYVKGDIDGNGTMDFQIIVTNTPDAPSIGFGDFYL